MVRLKPFFLPILLLTAHLFISPLNGLAAPLEPLRVYMDWTPSVEFAGMYAAIEKGWYRDAGIDLKMVFNGLDIIPNVIAGQADIGMHSGHDLIRWSATSSGLKAFAAQYQLNPNCIVVGKESNIKNLKELKGKTLGIFSKQDYDIYRIMLGFHGLSLSDVKFKEISTFKEIEIIALLRSKAVDAIIAWEFNWTIVCSLSF
jgi:ABC-type nitrate/sulfonate/bicarbonate transport system substrate-binding protein